MFWNPESCKKHIYGVNDLIPIVKKILLKLTGHDEVKKMITNVSWLAADRVLRMGLNLFIVGWMARYLGREQYGIYNYAMSFTVLAAAISSFGTNTIIVREILCRPEDKNRILGTSFMIRQFGGILTVIICVVAARFINSGDTLLQLLIFFASMTYLVGSFDVIDLYFQSQLKSKYAVIANNLAFLLLSSVRIALILSGAPLVAFVIAATAEVMVAQIGMVIVFKRTGHSILSWRWSYDIAKGLIKDSWPLMLSVISTMFYLRIGQVMLGKMYSYTELGDYSAAVKISEVWYFVPSVIYITIYPKIIEYRKIATEIYYARLQEFFSLMAFISYAAIVPVFFLNKLIITVIFGSQYVNAGAILSVHIWAGLFVAMGIARNSWCNVENYTKGVFYSTLAGAVANVLLNIPLITWYGGMGAAYATMIARVISGYASTFFISRKVFIMQTKSFYLSGLFGMLKKDFLK
ncbi:MAG: flippase [Chrysiogenales bacterium]|nr:MAG: flippase [Chrysiogenales bacterium]